MYEQQLNQGGVYRVPMLEGAYVLKERHAREVETEDLRRQLNAAHRRIHELEQELARVKQS